MAGRKANSGTLLVCPEIKTLPARASQKEIHFWKSTTYWATVSNGKRCVMCIDPFWKLRNFLFCCHAIFFKNGQKAKLKCFKNAEGLYYFPFLMNHSILNGYVLGSLR